MSHIEIILGGRAPEHIRTIILHGDEVWVSAEACGNSIALCALCDGITAIISKNNHVYLPLSWLEREFLNKADDWRKVRLRVKQAEALPIEDE